MYDAPSSRPTHARARIFLTRHILRRAGIVLIGCIYSGFTLIRASIPTIRLDDAAQLKKVIGKSPDFHASRSSSL